MSKKSVHIVFEVLNFLSSDDSQKYSLLPIDKLLLIFLAKHRGKKGIYPLQRTLAKELNIKERHLRDRTHYLVSLKLLSLKRKRHGYVYFLEFLTPAPECRSEELRPAPQCRSERHHSAGATITINPVNNTERARAKRAAPLSDDFEANKDSIKVAQSLGLTEDEANDELDKFFVYYTENGAEKADWNLVLQNWFLRAAQYKKRQKKESKPKDEVRSTAPWYNGDPLQAERIAKSLNLNDKGGHTNGLGSAKEGKR